MFLDARRRHKTPGSETQMSLLPAQQAAWAAACLPPFLWPPGSTCQCNKPVWRLYIQCIRIAALGTLSLGESTTFISRGKPACPLSLREMLPHPSRVLAADTTLRCVPGKEVSLAFSAYRSVMIPRYFCPEKQTAWSLENALKVVL